MKETPQDRWKKKAGYIVKGFGIYKDVADDFADACKKVGVSQSEQIAKMMKEFCDSVEKTEE